MNKFAELGFRGGQAYQDATPLMQRLADAASSFEAAWVHLETASDLVKSRIPEEYGTIQQTSLQTWQVWQSFERTCQLIEDIQNNIHFHAEQAKTKEPGK
jgi:hypothetical protein